MVARSTLFASVAALAGAASAQLQVIAPGGPNLWWVAQSQNNLIWNCKESQVQNFTVLIANTDPKILVAPIAIIAIQNNFDCSKAISTQQATLTPSTGYTVQLANPLNSTDVYATSDPFEVKALGSAYPAASATPTDSGASSTGAGAGSASGTAGGASQTPKSGAITQTVSLGIMGAALAGAVALVL